MNIEIGKKYLTRAGDLITILARIPAELYPEPWIGRHHVSGDQLRTWHEDGSYYGAGATPSNHDLVRAYAEPITVGRYRMRNGEIADIVCVGTEWDPAQRPQPVLGFLTTGEGRSQALACWSLSGRYFQHDTPSDLDLLERLS